MNAAQDSQKIAVRHLFDDGNIFAMLAKCRRATKRIWEPGKWELFQDLIDQSTCYDEALVLILSRFEEELS